MGTQYSVLRTESERARAARTSTPRLLSWTTTSPSILESGGFREPGKDARSSLISSQKELSLVTVSALELETSYSLSLYEIVVSTVLKADPLVATCLSCFR